MPFPPEAMRVAGRHPDVVICGLSCNPFTILRADHGSLPAQEHDDFSMIISFVDYLKARKPLGGILEEVSGFDRPLNHRSWRPMARVLHMPESWLKWLVGELESMGYAVGALRINNLIWVDVPRDRTLITC